MAAEHAAFVAARSLSCLCLNASPGPSSPRAQAMCWQASFGAVASDQLDTTSPPKPRPVLPACMAACVPGAEEVPGPVCPASQPQLPPAFYLQRWQCTRRAPTS